MRQRTKRAIESLTVSMLLVSAVFLFLPFTIFSGNSEEFIVPLVSILKLYLLPGVVLTTALTGAGVLLPEKTYSRYISALFALGMLVWLQGDFIVWKFGLIDGQTIDWGRGSWRGWLDGSIWVGLLAMSIVFHDRFSKHAMFACAVLLSLKLVMLGYVSYAKPGAWSTGDRFKLPTSPPESVYELSSRQNVIQFVLDAYQSDIFYEIVREGGDYYYTELEGFTYFPDTVGSFPTTKMSIPAILSAKTYKNRKTMSDFLDYALSGDTIPNILYDNGYQVDLVHTSAMFDKGRYTSLYLPPIPYGVTREKYEQTNARRMMDMVLLRAAPYFLKRHVYNDEQWLFQDVSGELEDRKSRTRHFAAKAFVQDFMDNMHVATDRPVYKFIHTITSHLPVVVRPDCEFAGGVLPATRENVKYQFRCSLDQVIDMLRRLKDMGLYDSSLIIIQGDHGSSSPVRLLNMGKDFGGNLMRDDRHFPSIAGGAMPCLLIKPPHSTGPMKMSLTQASLIDLLPTTVTLLGINEAVEGRSLFDIPPGETRERTYHFYRWKHENWQAEHFDHVYEFKVRGRVYDKASWSEGMILAEKNNSLYNVSRIDFGTPGSDPFKYYGWGRNEKSVEGVPYNWAVGKASAVFLAIPRDRDTTITASILSPHADRPQVVTVKVDDRKVGEWRLDGAMRLVNKSLVIPKNLKRPDVSVLEFEYALTQKPAEDRYGRQLAVLFKSITIE